VTAPALQRVVEAAAARVSGRLGCCVCPEAGSPWAAHRAEEVFATASVIKVPIAVAVAAEVEAGRLRWDQTLPPHVRDDAGDSGVIRHLSPLPYTVRDLVFLMLVVSDNRATNLLIDLVGMAQLNAYFARAGWERTLVVRRLGDFEARARGLENTSTPREICEVFLRLLRDDLLSPGAGGLLIEFLKTQVYRDRLPARLPRTTIVAHKTGDMPGVENDAGVFYLPAGRVVAAVFTNELASDVEGRLAIQEIGDAIYDAGRRVQ
jgi:beta-lactamase class A